MASVSKTKNAYYEIATGVAIKVKVAKSITDAVITAAGGETTKPTGAKIIPSSGAIKNGLLVVLIASGSNTAGKSRSFRLLASPSKIEEAVTAATAATFDGYSIDSCRPRVKVSYS